MLLPTTLKRLMPFTARHLCATQYKDCAPRELRKKRLESHQIYSSLNIENNYKSASSFGQLLIDLVFFFIVLGASVALVSAICVALIGLESAALYLRVFYEYATSHGLHDGYELFYRSVFLD